MREILRRWLKGLAVTTLKSIMCVQESLNQFGYICRGSWFSWVCMMITRAADQVGDLRYTWSLWHCCTLVLITTGKTIPQVQLQLWFHRETRRLRENTMGGCCCKAGILTFFKRQERDKRMPRNPTRSILQAIRFPFKKQEKEAIPGPGDSRPVSASG